DIPNTVTGSIAAAVRLPGVRLITLHTTGGVEMMRAARRAAGNGDARPLLLGVTILTSLDSAALVPLGINGPAEKRVIELAKLAQASGLDGVVASAHDVAAIRAACGPQLKIVVPGIRPAAADVGDQARVATAAEAVRAGADYLVVGRPITAAGDPVTAANKIREEMDGARN
ncbi:MAG: orotidine-5'-phosphate decarboxylase, partial [Candidatus Acidiferrales bacterium]